MHELSSPCERRENKLHVLWLLFSASSIWSSARGLFSFAQDSREKVEQNHTKFQMSWWLLWLFDSCILCGCVCVCITIIEYIIIITMWFIHSSLSQFLYLSPFLPIILNFLFKLWYSWHITLYCVCVCVYLRLHIAIEKYFKHWVIWNAL